MNRKQHLMLLLQAAQDGGMQALAREDDDAFLKWVEWTGELVRDAMGPSVAGPFLSLASQLKSARHYDYGNAAISAFWQKRLKALIADMDHLTILAGFAPTAWRAPSP